jgi:hypothetical protein
LVVPVSRLPHALHPSKLGCVEHVHRGVRSMLGYLVGREEAIRDAGRVKIERGLELCSTLVIGVPLPDTGRIGTADDESTLSPAASSAGKKMDLESWVPGVTRVYRAK